MDTRTRRQRLYDAIYHSDDFLALFVGASITALLLAGGLRMMGH